MSRPLFKPFCIPICTSKTSVFATILLKCTLIDKNSASSPLQVHVRHLVGGRAPSGAKALLDERLYEVQAPERLRAIAQLLNALSPIFNVRYCTLPRPWAVGPNF